MITITTKPFALTPEQYFKISWRRSRTKLLVIFGIYAVLALLMWLADFGWSSSILLLAIPLLALIYYIKIKRLTHSTKNKAIFIEHYLTITDTTISLAAVDGTTSTSPINHIVKVIRYPDYYLLYLSTLTFRYLPIRAFASTEDHAKFDQILRNLGLVK